MNRPPHSRSRSSAAIAVSIGLRTNAEGDARRQFEVTSHAAAAPSVAHGGAKICGTTRPRAPVAASRATWLTDGRRAARRQDRPVVGGTDPFDGGERSRRHLHRRRDGARVRRR